MVHRARPHNRKKSQKRRRQQSGTTITGATVIKGGRYARARETDVGDDITTGTTGRANVTEIETEDVYTIHAAMESISVRMKGCNDSELRKRIAQLHRHCPGFKMRKEAGIRYLDRIGNSVVDGLPFRPPWIEFRRTQSASKQAGNSGHLQPIPRKTPEYRTSKFDDDDVRELYGDHRPKRINTGSKNGSRMRCVDELPTVNEIGRKEAESDGIPEYHMPIGGHLETKRKLDRARKDIDAPEYDYHATHLDNI